MKTIITIGRQFGSGGREIGKKIAEELKIAYYDKELLAVASEKSGLAVQYLESRDEKNTSRLLHSLSIGYTYPFWGGNEVPVEQLAIKAQREAVLSVADQESCVIVGRCADYILRDHEGVFKIFISADPECRIQRVVKRDGVSPEEAREKIRRMDKARTSYYNFHTDQRWGQASNYDLCVNASRYGIDGTVRLILNCIRNQ